MAAMAALCFERISCAYETVVRVMEMSEAVVVEVMATLAINLTFRNSMAAASIMSK